MTLFLKKDIIYTIGGGFIKICRHKKYIGYTLVELLSVLAIIGMVLALGIPIVTDGFANFKTSNRDEIANTLTSVTKTELKDFDGKPNTPTTLFANGTTIYATITEESELDNVRNDVIFGVRDYTEKPDLTTVQALVNPKEKVTTWVVLLPHKSEGIDDPKVDMFKAEKVNIDFNYPIIIYVFKKDVETQVYINGLNFTEFYESE